MRRTSDVLTPLGRPRTIRLQPGRVPHPGEPEADVGMALSEANEKRGVAAVVQPGAPVLHVHLLHHLRPAAGPVLHCHMMQRTWCVCSQRCQSERDVIAGRFLLPAARSD